ncbi:hypothetical protein [Pseudobacteriovorax antillogorgiicola]|uniref:Uncharacterized protein n=1 Tax=Pseudobacteriovorax antillogorgiicola TaxID=1513793 RepID=A0A1Y6BVH2_9BACT|nr:hypothetical protein [Pseudobacteriovorax antillogorgiicola]TCS52284.1 hypothetical protein EDD56_10928 [Pseudobacteriovorax antillogorgiicola]SMF30663.1 hypothetical protein SAMN06296036_109185 [Pseudobacteriovorax antillogorgiicola]
MLRLLTIITLIGSTASSCQDNGSESTDGSQTASVTIGKFVPPEGSQAWATMNTDIFRMEETAEELAESLTLSTDSFTETESAASVDVILAYGFYRLELTYLDESGQELYRNCRPNETQRIDGPKIVLDILLCNASGAPVGNINEAFGIEIETEVQASDAQLAKAFDLALEGYQKHCQVCHGDERTEKNVTLIEAVKFSAKEPYTLRTLSVDAIVDGRMPKNPVASWEADQESFLSALRCLEKPIKEICETME